MAIDPITSAINSGADAFVKQQQAQLAQARDEQVAGLQSQYEQAVANGDLSIRDAENQFTKQKEAIDKQHYQNQQITALSANDMGIQNSMQFQGLQRGDLARRDSATQSSMSERDLKIFEIRERLKNLDIETKRNIGLANNAYNYGLAGARAQADLQRNQANVDWLQQTTMFDREQQAQREQMATQHGYNKEMSNLEFQQQVQARMQEAELDKQKYIDEYDIAMQRELAKYTPGTPEYAIMQGKLGQEREALLAELSTNTQFEAISNDIINNAPKSKPVKPKWSDFDKWWRQDKWDKIEFEKAMEKYDRQNKAWEEYQNYKNDPMSAFTNSGGLGSLSARYESNGNPGAIGRNAGDKGGASYGAYQMTTNSGNAQAFANSYGGALKGKKAGTKAFDDAWKAEAKKNPKKFKEAQHNYIANSHYKPALKKINKAVGFDLSKYPKAVQDVIWSVGVQHGSGGAANVFKKAGVKKGDSAETIIRKVYKVRASFFKSSSKAIQNSVAKRFKQEEQDALRMLKG